MKFKIDTAKMTYILSKVANGVGKKYTHPITDYLFMSLKKSELLVRSTNGVNFVTVVEKDIKGTNGECIVKAETLIKLVDKTTKDQLFFALQESYLEVKGNGTHKLPIISDTYPMYEFDTKVPAVEVNTDVLKRVFKVNESAIAKELILPYLTGYNVGEDVITTDGIKMCINSTKITEERVLITQQLADLISKTFTSETVNVQKQDNKLLICSDNITVFGTELDGLQDYPNISAVLSFEYANKAKLTKAELEAILDRISLFTDDLENNGIRLVFDDVALELEDLKANSQESMQYVDHQHQTEKGEILLSIDFFKHILNAVSSDIVEIQYDPEIPTIRIDDENVTLFLGTMNVVSS